MVSVVVPVPGAVQSPGPNEMPAVGVVAVEVCVEIVGEGLLKFVAGITPPSALAVLSFHSSELNERHHFVGEFIGYLIGGLVFWGVLTVIVRAATLHQFQLMTGRAPQPSFRVNKRITPIE